MSRYLISIFFFLLFGSCNQDSKFSTRKSEISQKIDISKIRTFCNEYINKRFGHLNPTTPAFDYKEDEIIFEQNGSLFVKKFDISFSILGKENICRATISGNLWIKGNKVVEFNQNDFSNYDCLGISKVSAKSGDWISVAFNVIDGIFIVLNSIPEDTAKNEDYIEENEYPEIEIRYGETFNATRLNPSETLRKFKSNCNNLTIKEEFIQNNNGDPNDLILFQEFKCNNSYVQYKELGDWSEIHAIHLEENLLKILFCDRLNWYISIGMKKDEIMNMINVTSGTSVIMKNLPNRVTYSTNVDYGDRWVFEFRDDILIKVEYSYESP